MPPLPAAVEVAAYWIAQEALTNVKRHAHAHKSSVRVAVEPTVLRLEIADDGAGLAGSTGIGLHTMKERAAEIGGTLRDRLRRQYRGGHAVAASLPRYERWPVERPPDPNPDRRRPSALPRRPPCPARVGPRHRSRG